VKKITKQDIFTIGAVFLFLWGIYSLSFSGFPVSDDEQMFAAVSQSISNGHGLEAPQLYGNNRLLGEYTGSGLLPVYLGAALLRLISNTGFGQVQALYLLSPIYTALTAALLVFTCASRFSSSASGTISWSKRDLRRLYLAYARS
jgi:hypothetical protein